MEINRLGQGGSAIQTEPTFRASSLNINGNRINQQSPEPVDENQHLANGKVKKVVDGLNQVLTAFDSHIKFVYHEELHKYYITVVDGRTNEVVKEIPPKKLLDIAAKIDEQIGLIVDKKI